MTLTTALVASCERPTGPQDLERASTHFLDWLGAILATRGTGAELGFGEAVDVSDGACSVLRSAGQHPEAAAFALGALGSLLEMDDLDRTSILHAGDTVCPAALCAALAADRSGPQFLLSLLSGYEISVRIGRAAASGGYTALYNSSTCGVFGAAMAASHGLGLNAKQKAYALGHAGMQASGLWQSRLEPGHAKQLATAHAARAGLTAARAAKSGLEAPLEILEGELGFFATLYPEADAAAVLTAPNDTWVLHEVSLKPWSACRHTHPAIAAALDLRADVQDPRRLRDISIATYSAALAFCDQQHPQNAHEARFSLQHCVAVALLNGPPTRADFEDSALRSAATVAELRDKIRLNEDPEYTAVFPAAYPATVEATVQDGRKITKQAPHAPGDPETPLTAAEVTEKFLRNCTDGGISATTAEEIHMAVSGLADAPDLSELRRTFDLIPATRRIRTIA